MQRSSKAAPAASSTQASTRSTSAQAAQESIKAPKARSTVKSKSKAAAPSSPQAAPAPQADPRLVEIMARQKADQIRELLLRARRACAEGRLIEPADDNAAFLYKAVLALDATQAEAREGTQRIAGVLKKEVEFAAAAGDQARARQYVGLIGSLQPNDGSLPELEARLRALDASPVLLSTRQQDRYSLSAQSIERARSHLDNQPLNLRTLDQAIDEYDRAAALVPDSPGLPLLKERITVLFPEATRRELADEKSRRALKLVETARQRGWTTAELEPLEAEIKATMRPGRYDTTLAECPDSVAQACAQVPR